MKQLLLASALTMALCSSALAQTSLNGDGNDKATGFSFVNADEQTPNTEPNIDATLANDAASEDTSPYVIQLSFSKDRLFAEGYVNDVQQSYAALVSDKSMKIEESGQGYIVIVDGFDSKTPADSWCVQFQSQSGKDCLVLDRGGSKTNARLAELTKAIKSGVTPDTIVVTGEPIEAMNQQRIVAHQFQRAWETADVKTSGVFEAQYCPTCVYKMNLRELMISNFELPRGEIITGYDVGDPTIFVAEVRGDNRLAIMSRAYGTDTNIQVYTESGRVYPIYVRSLDVQSKLLPDLVFRVIDPNVTYTEVKRPKTIPEAASLIDAPDTVDASKLLVNLKPQDISEGDFLKEIPFDPGKLRFDGFKVWGSSDRKLMPSRVFRDDKHIYIQYDDVSRLPGFTAYSVFDDIDERIGTRVSGNTFIIKGITDLVSLKSGNSYLCIQLSRRA